jgi:hypothetical protein
MIGLDAAASMASLSFRDGRKYILASVAYFRPMADET